MCSKCHDNADDNATDADNSGDVANADKDSASDKSVIPVSQSLHDFQVCVLLLSVLFFSYSR